MMDGPVALDNRRVLDVRLIPGGLMNRNCRVRLDGVPESVVLRLYDRDGDACGKEIAILQRLRRDVPVPDVLYAKTDPNQGRPPFAVLELVEGVSLRELALSGDAVAVGEAAYDAGRLLGRLQA
jgi:aminoglycoside phosphotransferase (APT) family kinase protein